MTADFLLTRPVSRTRILNSKALAAFTSLTLTNAVVWMSAFGFITLFRNGHEYDSGGLVRILASIVFFQLFFFSVGLVISLLVRRIRNVTPYALGLGFGMYILGAFSGMLGDVKLEWITPFKHFDAAYILRHNGYDMRLFGLDVAVVDGNVVTSQGPGTALPFAFKLVELLAGEKKAKEVAEAMLLSWPM
jgi:ABC-2 type transport system permease protein